MNMTVDELNKEQLESLKRSYLDELVDEGVFAEIMDVDFDEPTDEMLENINDYVSDDTIFEHYDGVIFTEDDF